jgi:hypothetical protein
MSKTYLEGQLVRSEDPEEELAKLNCRCCGGEKEESKHAAQAQEFVFRSRLWECREYDEAEILEGRRLRVGRRRAWDIWVGRLDVGIDDGDGKILKIGRKINDEAI